MNTNGTHNTPEGRILDAAAQALARTVDLRIEKERMDTTVERNHIYDATVILAYEQKKYRYAVEIKAIDRLAGLGLVKAQMEQCPLPWLLAAPYITVEIAEQCRAMGIQFIDAVGNAYLKADGLYIYITGQKRALKDVPAAKYRATTATGMRVVFALLCRPDLLNAPYRDIAAAAGVALGTVGWVFFALQDRGHLLMDKRKGRQFVDVRRVIEEWVLNYPVKLRPRLRAQRFHAPAADWWKKIPLEKYTARFGGEVAGDILTKYRNPGEVTIYLPGDPDRLIIDNRLAADPKGEVEILEQFWHFNPENNENQTVPPLLVYADLMATQDTRNHEVAKLVYERYIANA